MSKHLTEQQRELLALHSNLIKPVHRQRYANTKDAALANQSELGGISDRLGSDINTIETILEMSPDIRLAGMILTSSVCSPEGIADTRLVYLTKDTVVTASVNKVLLSIVEDEFKNKLKLDTRMKRIVEEVLLTRGSHVIAVLPENTMSALIAGDDVRTGSPKYTRENFNTSKPLAALDIDPSVTRGVLGKLSDRTVHKAFESLRSKPTADISIADYLEERKIDPEVAHYLPVVTDNLNVLRIPMLKKEDISRRIGEAYKLRPKTDAAYDNMFKAAPNRIDNFKIIDPNNVVRSSVSAPTELTLPSEAVIRVVVPGSDETAGIFVMIGQDGHPISRQTDDCDFTVKANASQDTKSSLDRMLSYASKNLAVNDRKPVTSMLTEFYGDILEEMLKTQLKNGAIGDATLTITDSIRSMMLARSLSSQFTGLVFIPNDLCEYIAYNYSRDHTGRSLVMDIKTVSSYRSIMMFSRVMAQIRNSIVQTMLKLSIDPNDPDWKATMDDAVSAVLEQRGSMFPNGLIRQDHLTNWSQRAGITVSVENHPGAPQTSIDMSTTSGQGATPDESMYEELSKHAIMGLGISPESVDQSKGAEFATTSVMNNTLTMRRTFAIQQVITAHVTSYVKKRIRVDGAIYGRLMDALKENEDKVRANLDDQYIDTFTNDADFVYGVIIDQFISLLDITLPRPDGETMDEFKTKFEAYGDILDGLIEQALIPDGGMDAALVGSIGDNIELIRSAVKAHFMREWMVREGFMTNLLDIVAADEDGNPMVSISNSITEHSKALIAAGIKLVADMLPIKRAADKDMETMNAEPSDNSYSSSSDAGGDDTGADEATADDTGADADAGGDGDFNFDMN